MDVVVFRPRAQVVERGAGRRRRGVVPADVGNRLRGVVEAREAAGDEAEAGRVWIFDGAGEEGLQANADAEEGLAGGDVSVDGRQVAARGELGETVAEVADAGEDQLLRREREEYLSARISCICLTREAKER